MQPPFRLQPSFTYYSVFSTPCNPLRRVLFSSLSLSPDSASKVLNTITEGFPGPLNLSFWEELALLSLSSGIQPSEEPPPSVLVTCPAWAKDTPVEQGVLCSSALGSAGPQCQGDLAFHDSIMTEPPECIFGLSSGLGVSWSVCAGSGANMRIQPPQLCPGRGPDLWPALERGARSLPF